MENKQKLYKAPSRLYEDSPNTRARKAKTYKYGELKFGKHEGSKKKISIRTFFGNPDHEVFNCAFDYDDQLLAAGCGDGSIKIFSLEENKLIHNLQGNSTKNSTPSTSVVWKPVNQKTKKNDQILYTTNADGTVMIWHGSTGKQLHRFVEQDHSIHTLTFNNNGDRFATAGKDFHIRLYDSNNCQQTMILNPTDFQDIGHSNRIFSLKYLHDDPNTLISCGWDQNIVIWDVRTGKGVGTIFGPSISGEALDYKDGEILTGSYRNQEQVQLWDFKTRKLIQNINWNENENSDAIYAYTASFSKIDDDTILVGGSGQNEVKLFHTDDYKPCASVVGMQEGIYASCYAHQNKYFAFGGGEGVVYIMQLNNVVS